MLTTSTRFVPTAAVLAVAMLFGGTSFAQTGGASNILPAAGSKQDPQVASPQAMPAAGTSTTTRAEVKAEANASNAIPNAGSKQDPDVTKATSAKVTKADKQAARAKRKAELAASGSSSNPVNPRSNPTGNAATNVETSATPTTKN